MGAAERGLEPILTGTGIFDHVLRPREKAMILCSERMDLVPSKMRGETC